MGLIRFILAVSVVIAHTNPFFGITMVGGQIAVEAFYIISGFYMSLILTEKYIGKNGSFSLFISNRLLRLMPIYWVVLIISLLFCLFSSQILSDSGFALDLYQKFYVNTKSLIFLVITHLIVIGQDVVMFLGLNPDGSLFFTSNFQTTNPQLHHFLLLPQAWTIGIEICFYLIAPFVLKLNWKWILTALLVSFGVRMYIFYGIGLTNDPWTYRFFPSELMFFLIGYFSYKISVYLKDKNISKYIVWTNLVIIVFYTLFFYDIPTFGLSDSVKEVIYYIYLALIIPMLFNYFKKSKLDNSIGELSYPIYLSHSLIIMVFAVTGISFSKQGLYVVPATIAFAYLLNITIANPIEKLRQKRIKIN